MQSGDSSRARQNFAKTRRRRQGGRSVGIEPIHRVDFVVHARFAARPSGDEGRDDEMRTDSFALAVDGLNVPVEGDDLSLDADLFPELAFPGGDERLPKFDDAPRQTEMADQRRPGTADEEDSAVSEDSDRNGEDRPNGEKSIVHGRRPGNFGPHNDSPGFPFPALKKVPSGFD
jgi:hypothetical protein